MTGEPAPGIDPGFGCRYRSAKMGWPMTDPADALARYDPKKLIRQLLDMDQPVPASARDCVFLWLMSLPEQVDPAEAARYLLDHVVTEEAAIGDLGTDLRRELEEVARYPSASLAPASGRRRGRQAGE